MNIFKKHTFIATLMLLFLLALRPSSVSLLKLAALSLLLLLFMKEKRMAGVFGLAGIADCSVCLLLYNGKVKEIIGVSTPLSVSVVNDQTIAGMYDYLLPEDVEDAPPFGGPT